MFRALLPYRHVVGVILLLSFTPACAQEATLKTPSAAVPDSLAPAIPYAFDQPAAVFRLPNRLREISGLTVLDDRLLGAVQDEKGELFLIDVETGKVEDVRDFGKNGDYEGLERVGDRVFVLRSDGTLFEIEDWRADDLQTKKHETPLRARHDTEGLAYDAARGRLLIACKEDAGRGLKNQRAIYAFDLETNTLLDAPVYTIDLNAFAKEAGADGGLNERIRSAVGPALNLSGFKPSALALHPLTQRIYVLSSVRKALAILSPDGALEDVWMLPDKSFPQPESIAFLPNGDLFIASEGKGKKATLMRFTYRP